VRRRYNQFDWLHERLDEKYPNICVPPLPDKALKGNFEEDFILQRKAKLELWLNRLSSHPVISESEVFIHFLQCDESSAKWKAGKRKAEKDDYRGAQWFSTLTVPGESSDTIGSIKERVEKFSKAATFLDYTVKNVCSGLDKVSSLHQTAYKKVCIFQEFLTNVF
jgi:sorting nexin-9/18/33